MKKMSVVTFIQKTNVNTINRNETIPKDENLRLWTRWT